MVLRSEKNITLNARNSRGQMTGQLTVGESPVLSLSFSEMVNPQWNLKQQFDLQPLFTLVLDFLIFSSTYKLFKKSSWINLASTVNCLISLILLMALIKIGETIHL